MNPLAFMGLLGAGLYIAGRNGSLFGAQIQEGDLVERGKPLVATMSIRNDGPIAELVTVRMLLSYPDFSTHPSYDMRTDRGGPVQVTIDPGQTVQLVFRSDPILDYSYNVYGRAVVNWSVKAAGKEYTGSTTFKLPERPATNLVVSPVMYSQ